MLFLLAVLQQQTTDYALGIERWRVEQQSSLTRPDGWLSVAGLFWLAPGSNPAGSDPTNTVTLPARVAGKKVGEFVREGDHVRFQGANGLTATVNGRSVSSCEMTVDASRSPTKLNIGDVTLVVIKRGERVGIRMFDPQSEARRAFTGRKWFPVNPKMVIHAKFVPYNPVRQIPITNVLGDTSMSTCPGHVEFTVAGHACRLEAEGSGGGLFFNFQDASTGKETYPAGRFLDADAPKNGEVIIDFNKATNPPCAFTSFATCPLPPQGNRLPVAIRAGEKTHRPPGE